MKPKCTKTKFFENNKDIFLKYFEPNSYSSASEIYDSMITGGRFKEMEAIIAKENNGKWQDKALEHLTDAGKKFFINVLTKKQD